LGLKGLVVVVVVVVVDCWGLHQSAMTYVYIGSRT
jgi:hypothetical protein